MSGTFFVSRQTADELHSDSGLGRCAYWALPEMTNKNTIYCGQMVRRWLCVGGCVCVCVCVCVCGCGCCVVYVLCGCLSLCMLTVLRACRVCVCVHVDALTHVVLVFHQ